MPPKSRFSREAVVDAAFSLVRTKGEGALNARSVAKQLGCSTQPIFCHFSTMEELKAEVFTRAYAHYTDFITHSAALAASPYKATGMAYILFARDEPELFKMMFMRDRMQGEAYRNNFDDSMPYVLDTICQHTGFDRETALALHLRLWIFSHGLAVMIATNYLPFDDGQISQLLSDEFAAMYRSFKEKQADVNLEHR